MYSRKFNHGFLGFGGLFWSYHEEMKDVKKSFDRIYRINRNYKPQPFLKNGNQ